MRLGRNERKNEIKGGFKTERKLHTKKNQGNKQRDNVGWRKRE